MASSLSERDLKLLASAWQCFDAPPVVDMTKLALLENYKTAASARTAWINLRKKLNTLDPSSATGNGSGGGSGTATPKKRKANEDDGNVTPKPGITCEDGSKGGDDDPPAAKKTRKAAPKPRGRVKKEQADDDEKVLSPEPVVGEPEPVTPSAKGSPTKKRATPKPKVKKETVDAEPADGDDDSTIVVATKQSTGSPTKKTKAKEKDTKPSVEDIFDDKTATEDADNDKTINEETDNANAAVNDNAPVTPSASDNGMTSQ